MMRCCVICTEDFDSNRQEARLTCHCTSGKNQAICEDCVHSHIISILREGLTGEGRKDLKCPLGCGEELTDAAVRASIRSFHYSLFHAFVGRFLWYLWLCLQFLLGDYNNSSDRSSHSDRSTIRRRIQCRLTQSREERKELELYERWSLTVGLSRMVQMHEDQILGSSNHQQSNDKTKVEKDANYHYVHVTRCPRPDCECLWLTNKTFRNEKLKHEHKFNTPGISKTKSFLQSANAWLFYAPTTTDQEETIMNQSGNYTIQHWLQSTDIDPFTNFYRNKPVLDQADDDDGRKLLCPSCYLQFCGLCLRPWTTIYKNKRIKHSGMTCNAYAKKSPEKDNDDYIMAADLMGAKCCPGCSMRTDRTEGCNHMTCPCGYQWCYICECRWSVGHYSCREKSPTDPSSNSVCIIS